MEKLTLQREPLPVGDNFLQTPFWAHFKEHFGWQAHTFCLDMHGYKPIHLLILSRPIALGYRLAYLPHPNLHSLSPPDLAYAIKYVAKDLKRYIPKLFAVRWDLDLLYTEDLHQTLSLKASSITNISIQPKDTILIDLKPDTQTIFNAMHKKTRYNIRLAQKKGVEVRKAPIQEVVRWYDLYKETAKRDGINIHSLEYYQQFFNISHQRHYHPQAHLLLAYHEEDLLAGIILLTTPNNATYVYGASSNHKRNFMPSYALQWHAIQLAKELGCKSYDMFGIPPSDNPDHPMHGLYQFKTGFGGSIQHFIGLWDTPTNPLVYAFYRKAENLRSKRMLKKKR